MDEEQTVTGAKSAAGVSRYELGGDSSGSQTEPQTMPAKPDNTIDHAATDSPNNLYDTNKSINSSAHGEATQRKSIIQRFLTVIRLHNNVSTESPALSYKHRLEQIIRSLDEYDEGYGKLAAIESCDPNFLIYRKFLWLHNRVLLKYQDELAELEEDLESLDRHDYQNDDKRLISRRRDDAFADSERKELIKMIAEKLASYDELLIRFQQVEAMKRPTERNQNSLYNLIHHTSGVATMESDWVQYGPDLAAVARDQEYGWFNEFLEDLLNKISRKLTRRIFRTGEQKATSDNELLTLLSPYRLDIFLRFILTILAAVLLLGPVLILIKLQPSHVSQIERKSNLQILVVFLFTILFSAFCSIVTQARRQETLAATTAYCAVLVVFLGNTSIFQLTASPT